jgi:hypothetical protein
MITPIPIQQRQRRYKPRQTAAAPLTLALVSASYNHSAPSLTLVFNQAISIAGLHGASIVVEDGTYSGSSLTATGSATLTNSTTLVLGLVVLSDSTPGLTLMASSGNGIVAVNGGAAWVGVTALALPFP